MPIRITFDENIPTLIGRGGAFPIFVCDHCGERIVDGRLGAYLFEHGANTPGRVTSTAFVHKGACHDALEKSGPYRGWGELSAFLTFLAVNANLADLLDPKAGPQA